MKVWLVALLATILFAVGAHAQEAHSVEDAQGDQQVLLGGAVPHEDARFDRLDLRSLTVQEESQGIRFILDVGSIQGESPPAPVLDYVRYHVYFTYVDVDYRLVSWWTSSAPVGDTFAFAYVERYDTSEDDWDGWAEVEGGVDEDSDRIDVLVRRESIQDTGGASLRVGYAITDIWAESETGGTINVGVAEHPLFTGGDRLPDDGSAPFQVPIVVGVQQDGHAWLHSEEPLRISNGEATTFIITVEAGNDAGYDDTFEFRSIAPPAEWVVTFPEETIRIDAGESIEVPILITVPFNHEHGAVMKTLVEMHSRSDPLSVGRIEVGVRYTEVPQPAGHHDTLYIHTSPDVNFGNAYMNTLLEDPLAGEASDTSNSISCSFDTVTNLWYIGLQPRIQMGLDFDVEREGEITVQFESLQPRLGARLVGELWLFRPGTEEQPVIAELVPTEPQDIMPNEVATYTTSIVAMEHADYLPYVDDSYLQLRLGLQVPGTLAGCISFGMGNPALLPGGVIRLPLDEYHDDVDDYFQTLSGIDLYTVGEQQKLVNPGETVVFRLNAENIGVEDGTFELQLSGSNPEWAQILGSSSIRIPGQQTRELAVAITAPDGAGDGTLADITLIASKKDDPNVRSLIRLLAEVDTEADHPDEAGDVGLLEASLQEEAPGPSIVLAALAAVTMAAYHRRRR